MWTAFNAGPARSRLPSRARDRSPEGRDPRHRGARGHARETAPPLAKEGSAQPHLLVNPPAKIEPPGILTLGRRPILQDRTVLRRESAAFGREINVRLAAVGEGDSGRRIETPLLRRSVFVVGPVSDPGQIRLTRRRLTAFRKRRGDFACRRQIDELAPGAFQRLEDLLGSGFSSLKLLTPLRVRWGTRAENVNTLVEPVRSCRFSNPCSVTRVRATS